MFYNSNGNVCGHDHGHHNYTNYQHYQDNSNEVSHNSFQYSHNNYCNPQNVHDNYHNVNSGYHNTEYSQSQYEMPYQNDYSSYSSASNMNTGFSSYHPNSNNQIRGTEIHPGPMIGPVRPEEIQQYEEFSETKYFPVSHGINHKKDAEGYTPRRPSIPPDVMSKMAIAKSRLEISPNDPRALQQLHEAMNHYHSMQNAKNANSKASQYQRRNNYGGPGIFTGECLVEPMSKGEIDCNDVRSFARPDMFNNLKPMRENYGKKLMKRMGWREGKPLGMQGKGSLAPIQLTVKVDRKGLANNMEHLQRKPEGLLKNEGPQWICKVVNGKNPISGLGELHQALGVNLPVFEATSDDQGNYKWSVKTTFGTFTPETGGTSKKIAKSQCAHFALKQILKNESARIGIQQPSEAEESHHLRVLFVPSNKSIGGKQLLYNHFYKGSNLMNVNQVLKETPHCPKAFVASTNKSVEIKPETRSEPAATSSHPTTAPGVAWMIDAVNGKGSVSALGALSEVSGKSPSDEFSKWKYQQHVITLTTPWGTHTCHTQEKNRKKARDKAYHYAVKTILSEEAERFAVPVPIESSKSTMDKLHFEPGKYRKLR